MPNPTRVLADETAKTAGNNLKNILGASDFIPHLNTLVSATSDLLDDNHFDGQDKINHLADLKDLHAAAQKMAQVAGNAEQVTAIVQAIHKAGGDNAA